MAKSSLRQLFKVSVLTSATLLALSAHPYLQERNDGRRESSDDRHDRDDDRRDDGGRGRGVALATGQFVTPTAIDDEVQLWK
jgi:hypothetical protein